MSSRENIALRIARLVSLCLLFAVTLAPRATLASSSGSPGASHLDRFDLSGRAHLSVQPYRVEAIGAQPDVCEESEEVEDLPVSLVALVCACELRAASGRATIDAPPSKDAFRLYAFAARAPPHA